MSGSHIFLLNCIIGNQLYMASIFNICFAPVFSAACCSDRSIILYDTRDTGPIRKIVMKMRANSLCWNPMEAFNFTVANEDYK